MALDFPANPAAQTPVNTFSPTSTPEANTSNDLVYIWDGEKWKNNVDAPSRDTLQPPVVDGVTLTDNNITGNRYTSETFGVAPNITTGGDPASTQSMKVEVNDAITTTHVTDTISTVDSVAYSEDVQQVAVNENGWQHIGWAGPPFNRYFAFSSSGSNNNYWAWSTDGKNWTQFSGLSGAGRSYGAGWCYRTVDQKIYVMDQGRDTNYYTISTLEQALGGTNDGSIGQTTRPHDNNSWRGYMSYDERNDRICTIRGPWDVGNTYVTVTPFPSTMNNSDWVSCGGISGANLGGGRVVDNGTNAFYVGNSSPHNEATYNSAWQINLNTASPSINSYQYTRDTNSYSGYPWYDPVNTRWYQNGWAIVNVTPSAGGGSIGSYDDWTTAVKNGETTQLNHGFWSTQLQRNIVVGSVQLNGTYQACHWVSSADGSTWTRYLTPNPNVNQSYWRFGLDATDVGLHLLCASSGSTGKRFGYSTTMGTSYSTPRLTLASSAGLTGFVDGQSITQSDSGATGTIAAVDYNDNRITVIDVTGNWVANSSNYVVGSSDTFVTGYLVFNSSGAVSDVVLTDPGFVQMAGSGPFTLTFPATLTGSVVPDDILASGTTMTASVKATSTVNGFSAESVDTSNTITPAA